MVVFINQLKSATQEFRRNKLRNFLSLASISFGIFVIISVLSVVTSLQLAIGKELEALGSRVIFIQKWPSGAGEDYPWWKFVNRPEVSQQEMKLLMKKMPYVKNMACLMYINAAIEWNNSIAYNVKHYGITEKYNGIQQIPIADGRFFMPSDFAGSNTVVMGYDVAEQLFGNPSAAVNKVITLKEQKKAVVIGVIKKQGKTMLDGWDYDQSVLLTYAFTMHLIREKDASPVIMIQGNNQLPVSALEQEARGWMRSIRKLHPTQNDNFSINDIDGYARQLESNFSVLRTSGWIISALALFIGMFNIANIMFAVVYERMREIGLKKALGARKATIVLEFMTEAILLSLLGGLLGLLMTGLLIVLLPRFIHFGLFIPAENALLAFGLSIGVGIMSGFIPSVKAARMDPVLALSTLPF